MSRPRKKIKNGCRTRCEHCDASISHNQGEEHYMYCSPCRKMFEQDDFDLAIFDQLIKTNNTIHPKH